MGWVWNKDKICQFAAYSFRKNMILKNIFDYERDGNGLENPMGQPKKWIFANLTV